MPSVLNKRNVRNPTTSAVYVGRPSIWGNPFQIGLHGNRSQVIALYRQYLLKHPELMRRLPYLKDRDLICWCAPLPCHADILLELANK